MIFTDPRPLAAYSVSPTFTLLIAARYALNSSSEASSALVTFQPSSVWVKAAGTDSVSNVKVPDTAAYLPDLSVTVRV